MHLAQIESAPGERGEKAKRKQRSANRRSIGRRNGRGLLVSIHYLSFAKELPGNHQALNLARAFANRAQLQDRKSTRLNSSHRCISYAVFCLKKKKIKQKQSH